MQNGQSLCLYVSLIRSAAQANVTVMWVSV
jgi:hypothetical protein